MDEKTFKARIKKLAVAIIKEADKLPRSLAADVIGRHSSALARLLGQIIALRAAPDRRLI